MTAGAHTITFVGVGPSGDYSTAFVDAVSVDNISPMGSSGPGLEDPTLGTGQSAFRYRPAGSPRTFIVTAGIAGNDSALTGGNPNAPEGGRVGFVQVTGSVSQAVNTAAPGSYRMSYGAAQRANDITGYEAVKVEVDGGVVSIFYPTNTTCATDMTALFNLTAGTHTIAFVGNDPTETDDTLSLDEADLIQAG